MRWSMMFVASVCVSVGASSAIAQHYNDGQGKEWRHVPSTMGLSWNQVATVCPTDGATPCSGVVAGRDMNGWRWGTREQVQRLFAGFVPEIMTANCVGGPQYAGVGIYALGGGVIAPTWSAYTTFGGSLFVQGWNLSRVDDPAFAEKVQAAQVELNRETQATKWHELSKEAAQQMWVVPTRFGRDQRLAGTKVGPIFSWSAYGSYPYPIMYAVQ